MKMKFSNPWVLLPVALSAIFAVLFFPVVSRTQETPFALLYTAIGVLVIWAAYAVRARIFSRWSEKDGKSDGTH